MSSNNIILITGASTGIGKACAVYLAKKGFTVYAGVRKETDAENLKSICSERIRTVILDVTVPKLIADSLNIIENETDGKLFALINNAGIGRSGVLEALPIEEIRKVMEVNVIGLMAMTKAMIPLLRKNKGRIINIGSTSSFLSFPGASAYAGSKFAVRAITDSLRLELNPFGVSVSLVAPGAIESEIWKKSKSYKEKLRKNISPQIINDYKTVINFGDKLLEKVKPIPADEVAKSVEHALTAKKPKRYYYVGADCKGVVKFSKLPMSLTDKILLKQIKKLGK